MPSSSLFLRSCTTLVSVLSLFSTFVNAFYYLEKEYSNASFFDEWDFYNALDPSKGFVNYVDRETAKQAGLIRSSDGGDAFMAVDSTNTYDANKPYQSVDGYGRPSVRIMTQRSFYHGLFVADIKHMPYGCGTWPAFWALGASGNWPSSGEIDIVEGVNNRQNSLAVLHTGDQCKIAGDSRTMTGTLQNADCFYDVTTGQGAVGCAILDTDTRSYGRGLNDAGGAVLAMEWTSDAIKIWSFPRQEVPGDLVIGVVPDPSRWGLPAQTFNGPDCDIDDVIKPQKLLFNTDFCGDFGEAVWRSEGCAASTGYDSCAAYVGANPAAFADAYWQIGSLKYYKQVTGTIKPTLTSSTRSTSYTTLATETLTTTTTSFVVETSSITTQPPDSLTTLTIGASVLPTLISTTIQTSTATLSTTSSTTTSSTTLSSVTFTVLPTISFPTSATSSLTATLTTSVILSPIVSFTHSVEPTSVISYTISPITTSSSDYAWSGWIEPSKLTSGKPEGSFFLPPMGSGIPITSGWDAPRPGPEWGVWSPVTLTSPSPSIGTSVWVEWPEKVITITKTWIEPCETGYTTKTTIIVTEHCGCTETPIPKVPMKVITTTCPESWGFKTPLVITVPDTAAATQPARPSKPTGKVEVKVDAAETWSTWKSHAKTSAENPTATWISWGSNNGKPPADDTVTWTSWVPSDSKNKPKAPAATSTTWAQWHSSPDSDNKNDKANNHDNSNNKIPAAADTATQAIWSTIPLIQTPTPTPTPASAPASTASSSPSQIWENWHATGVASGHVAKYTGAATKVSIATGVLGVAVMVAAFVV